MNDIQYVYKGKLNAFARIVLEDDVLQQVNFPNGDNGVIQTYVNFGSNLTTVLGVGMSGSYFNDYLYANNSIEVSYVNENGAIDGQPIITNSFGCYLNLYNSVVVSKKINLSVVLNYNFIFASTTKMWQNDPWNFYAIGISKIFAERLTVTLNWNGEYNVNSKSWNNGIETKLFNHTNRSYIYLNMSYKFGNNIKSARQRSTASDGLKSRL